MQAEPRVSASWLSPWRFDALRPTEHDLPLPNTLDGTILAHNYPEGISLEGWENQ
jgi:hypothetical protein